MSLLLCVAVKFWASSSELPLLPTFAVYAAVSATAYGYKDHGTLACTELMTEPDVRASSPRADDDDGPEARRACAVGRARCDTSEERKRRRRGAPRSVSATGPQPGRKRWRPPALSEPTRRRGRGRLHPIRRGGAGGGPGQTVERGVFVFSFRRCCFE
jgi:hypothetical protein